MKLTFLLFILLCSLNSYATLRSPKTIVLKTLSPAGAPGMTITFDDKMQLEGLPGTAPSMKKGDPTHTCEVAYDNFVDHALRYNNHAFMDDHVKVTINGKLFFVTPSYSVGGANAYGNVPVYFTTLVYENSEDCYAQKNPLRILIGVYSGPTQSYTSARDFDIGWERDNDEAVVYGEKTRWLARGKVTAWY